MNIARFIFSGNMAAVGVALVLGGCTNLSGLSGKKDFACEAPDGVSCMSISGVSANVDRGNLPSYIKQKEKDELTGAMINGSKESKDAEREAKGRGKPLPLPAYSPDATLSPATMLTVGSGTPVRVPPKEMRIWIAPTEDTDGDLHEQRYIYVVVNDGRWMVDATRLNTRNKYTQFQPLVSTSNTPDAKPAPNKSRSPQRNIQPASQPVEE